MNLDRPWCTSTLDSCTATAAATAAAAVAVRWSIVQQEGESKLSQMPVQLFLVPEKKMPHVFVCFAFGFVFVFPPEKIWLLVLLSRAIGGIN